MAFTIDNIDKRILRMLQEDGRITITEMSENLRMTRSAIRYRIRHMETEGVIMGYTVIIDPHKLESPVLSRIILKVKPVNIPTCVKELKASKEVIEVHRLAGESSLSITSFFRNDEHRNNFILNRLEKLPIEGYILQTVLEVVKHKGYPL